MKTCHLIFAALAVFLLWKYWGTVSAPFHPANKVDAAGGWTERPATIYDVSQQGYQ